MCELAGEETGALIMLLALGSVCDGRSGEGCEDCGEPDGRRRHRAARLGCRADRAGDGRSNHLHVFETSFGTSGSLIPNNWRHEIVVEKVLDADESVTYSRCTGGRRATLPEVCGGIWSYADLLDLLVDPAHPEHANSLEWLGWAVPPSSIRPISTPR